MDLDEAVDVLVAEWDALIPAQQNIVAHAVQSASRDHDCICLGLTHDEQCEEG